MQYYLHKIQNDKEFRAELPEWYKERFEDEGIKEEVFEEEPVETEEFGFSKPL